MEDDAATHTAQYCKVWFMDLIKEKDTVAFFKSQYGSN